MQYQVRTSGQSVKMVLRKSMEILNPIIHDAIDSALRVGLPHTDAISIAQASIEDRCPSVGRVVCNWAQSEGLLPVNVKIAFTVTAGECVPEPGMKFYVSITFEKGIG